MSRRSDQKELLEDLSNYLHKMNRDDYDLYSMFIKRQKDDEDFENESFERLQNLHAKYKIKRQK